MNAAKILAYFDKKRYNKQELLNKRDGKLLAENKIQSTVYIDEAGDLGVNRGMRWFVLTAVVVDKNIEPVIQQKLHIVKTKLNVKDIHMRNILVRT